MAFSQRGRPKIVSDEQRKLAASLCVEYRKERDLSQSQMADELGGKANQLYVSLIENARHAAPAWTVLRVLEICQPETVM